MSKSKEEYNISEEEILEAVQELRPTYYDIVGIPYNVREQKPVLESDLKEYIEKVDELNRKMIDYPSESANIANQIGVLNMLIAVIGRTLDDFDKKGNYNRLFIDFCLYKIALASHQKTGIRKKGTTADEKEINRVVGECEEKIRILKILSTPEKKAAYDAELLKKATERVEEKREEARLMRLDERNRGIERRRLRRAAITKGLIYERYKQSIDEDKGVKTDIGQDQSIDKSDYRWGFKLYPERRKILSMSLEYPDSELDQKLEVYGYGAFSYKHLFREQQAKMENSIGEIIGIHKTDIYGNTKVDFLIAQTMQLGHWDLMSRDEIKTRAERGEEILILREEADFMREEKRRQRQLKMEESRPEVEKLLIKLKEKVVPKKPRPKHIRSDGGIIENVFVYERQPAKISREQADLLGYILYSDTMIEKAKRERFGYIGDIRQTDLWFDPEIIAACRYASKKPGFFIDQFGKAVKIGNISTAFKITKEISELRERVQSARKFPSLDD